MSYCVAQPIAVCLYVQILGLAQSADTLNTSLWRLQCASLLYHTLYSEIAFSSQWSKRYFS